MTQRSYCHDNTKPRRVREYEAAQIGAGRMTILYYAIGQLLVFHKCWTRRGCSSVVFVIKRLIRSLSYISR